MRRLRHLAAATLLGALLLPATAARADEHLGLHDMDCTGITAMGTGLPKSTPLHLALVDPAKGEALVERQVRTSPAGAFETRLQAALYQRLSVRLLVTGPGGKRIGFAEHVMAEGSPMCDLPFTGTGRTALLLAVGAALLGAGTALLLLTRRRLGA